MSGKKGWDLRSTNSLVGGAEWLRKSAGAIAVVVVRANDSAMAVDLQTTPSSAAAIVATVLPELARAVNLARHQKREELERKKEAKA